jgi:anti-anti-sigma regulatory factor
VSTAVLRPRGVLDAVEAMSLRDNFRSVLENSHGGVIVDLTGVEELSAAGLAAVTNLLGQGRRTGIPVRVLPPDEGSEAALIIEQADLRRFLSPGGVWNSLPNDGSGPTAPDGRRRAWSLRPWRVALRRTGADAR